MNYSKFKGTPKTSVPRPQDSVNVHAPETSKNGTKPESD